MAENSIDRKKVRDDLKIQRTELFEGFLRHPEDTRLALSIRIIDNQIANCNERIRTENKTTEMTEENTALEPR